MINQIFDKTLKAYGIQAKALSELSGVTENHISEFRRGKLRTGVTTDVLLRLLEAMDELSPGSREYFCLLLAGGKGSQKKPPMPATMSPLLRIEQALDELDEEGEDTAMLLMARKLRKSDLRKKVFC